MIIYLALRQKKWNSERKNQKIEFCAIRKLHSCYKIIANKDQFRQG